MTFGPGRFRHHRNGHAFGRRRPALSGITNASGAWFVQPAPDSDGTDVFLSTVCFVAGTRIQTPDGERPVERLSRGGTFSPWSTARRSHDPSGGSAIGASI